jgi:hypothetical protein
MPAQAPDSGFPGFVILAPDYTAGHSGVRCLFLLCHHLNRLGYRARITGRLSPPGLLAPEVEPETTDCGRGGRDVVIYPEVVSGNPLEGARVVRYLLGVPHPVWGRKPEDYDRDDYVIHFDDAFRPASRASRRLTIPLVDRTVFSRTPAAEQRDGYLIYSVRHQPDRSEIPDWVRPRTWLTRKTWRKPEELAALYRRSKALVVWERTAAMGEAMRCGCPTMIIPHDGFDPRPMVEGCMGLGYTIGWNQRGARRALVTVRLLEMTFALNPLLLDRRIHRFVRDVRRHFDAVERSGGGAAADRRWSDRPAPST